MNNTLEDIFKEKNEKIYIDKLLLDVDNNLDSLKLTTSNCLCLYSSKMRKKLSSFFNEIDTEYKMQELSIIVEDEEKSILETIHKLVETKSKKVKNHIGCDTLKDSIHKEIDKTTDEFEANFKSYINEEMYINFKNNMISKYELHTEENLDRFGKMVETFNNDIYSNVCDAVRHRDNTLKNITDETYTKYVNMNQKTADLKKIKKMESE